MWDPANQDSFNNDPDEEKPLIIDSSEHVSVPQIAPLNFFQQIGFGVFNVGLYLLITLIVYVVLPNLTENFAGSNKGLALGIIFSVSNVFYAILGPVFGYLSDITPPIPYLGQRKPFIIFLGLAQSVGVWLLFLSPNVYILGLVYTGLTVSFAVGGPALTSLLADVVPKNQRGAVSGYTTAFSQLGGIMGSFTGFLLSDISSKLLSLIIGIFALLTMLVTLVSIPSNPPHKKQAIAHDSGNLQRQGKEHVKNNFFHSFKDPDFCFLLLGMFLINSGDSIARVFMEYFQQNVITETLLFDKISMTSAESKASAWSFVQGCGSIIGALVFPIGSDMFLWGRKVWFWSSIFLLICAVIILLLWQTLLGSLVAALFYGVGYGAQYSMMWLMLSDLLQFVAPDQAEKNAKESGMWLSAMLSPKIFIPLLGGIAIDQLNKASIHDLGYYVIYIFAAFLFILSALAVWPIKKVK